MINGSVYTFRFYAGYLLSGNGSFAVWTGSSAPTSGQCRTWVLTHGGTDVILTSSMQLCVLTGSGHTGYVTITSLASDGSTAEAQVTVWDQ